LLISSCNTTSSLQDGEVLLDKNKINFSKKIKTNRTFKEELLLLPAQSPNRKMFGLIPFRLGIYNSTYNKKENKFRWWLKNKVGEAPIIHNNFLTETTKETLRLFMFNKGYLNTKVSAQTEIYERKATVSYLITPNEQFIIDKVTLPKDSNTLLRHLKQGDINTLIHEGDALDINTLDAERKRISDHLRNQGYFNFRKDYVQYELDTNNIDKTASILFNIKEPAPNKWHKKYTVNDIYVYVDYNTSVFDTAQLDTVSHGGYHYIYANFKLKPKAISNGIFFEKDTYFRLDAYQNTLKKLANFGTFKFVDIQFSPFTKAGKEYLNTYIYLTSSKKQTVSVDLELNHNFIGLTGSAISFTYQNKNLTKAADLLEFKISTGVEFNFGDSLSALNNADFIIETNYYLNKFLVPFPLKKVSKNNNVRTKFQIQYNFERRIQFYSLHSTSFSFGYEWNETSNKKHTYNPIYTNLLLIPKKEQEFIDKLELIPSLKRSFEEQIILGSNYTFVANNKKSINDRSYSIFQGKIALAGNLIHLFKSLTKNAKNSTTPYKIFNREYSQFVRFESTVVHNYDIGPHSSLNSRFNGGIIVSYGNSTVAPYFQQFYVGGSNSIRAFKLRALGPGTYSDTTSYDNASFFFDQAGEFKLEMNTELRFDIYKWFKGALFVDAGNVWLIREDPDREGGLISKDNFLNAIAVGVGFGLRLDFEYFIIRTDLSLPMIDPRYDYDQRYPINEFQFNFGKNSWFRKYSVFHLAIGYPF